MSDLSEEQVKQELADAEPVDQEDFVSRLTNGGGDDRQQVFGSLKSLMKRDEVSYTIDWKLQTEE